MANKSSKKKAVAKMTTKVGTSKSPAPISAAQWAMPTSYSADGTKMASLREVVDPNSPTLSLGELSPDQRAELVAKRIESQPSFQIAMVGAGVLDQERAIAEVKGQTKIGRALMEIEQRVINHQVDKASKIK